MLRVFRVVVTVALMVGGSAQAFPSEERQHKDVLELFESTKGPNERREQEIAAYFSRGFSEVKANFSYSLWPRYPRVARNRRHSGRGVICLHIDPKGNVNNARMLISTGHEILDDATLASVRQWRAKPVAPRHIDIPIDFVLQEP